MQLLIALGIGIAALLMLVKTSTRQTDIRELSNIFGRHTAKDSTLTQSDLLRGANLARSLGGHFAAFAPILSNAAKQKALRS